MVLGATICGKMFAHNDRGIISRFYKNSHCDIGLHVKVHVFAKNMNCHLVFMNALFFCRSKICEASMFPGSRI